MNTTGKLNRLAELQAQADAIRLQFTELRNATIGAEILAKLEEMDIEEASAAEPVNEEILRLTAEIKADVLAAGKGEYKGAHLQAVWAKGRVSWDTKALDGYAAGHPEILPFRKEGEPSVTIRGVK